jgi:hypothetical protein
MLTLPHVYTPTGVVPEQHYLILARQRFHGSKCDLSNQNGCPDGGSVITLLADADHTEPYHEVEGNPT